jgi:hypothetical protein
VEADQLEGESFQPAYTPYVAPAQAYDSQYVPVEQRGIEAAVAAGAAGYNGVSRIAVGSAGKWGLAGGMEAGGRSGGWREEWRLEEGMNHIYSIVAVCSVSY